MQQGPVFLGQLTERGEVARLGWYQPHVAGDRLEQDRGDLAGEPFQDVGHGAGVVEWAEERVLRGPFGDAGLLGVPSVVAAEPA